MFAIKRPMCGISPSYPNIPRHILHSGLRKSRLSATEKRHLLSDMLAWPALMVTAGAASTTILRGALRSSINLFEVVLCVCVCVRSVARCKSARDAVRAARRRRLRMCARNMSRLCMSARAL